jgi:hypothetical protein
MLRVVPFQPDHLAQLAAQASQPELDGDRQAMAAQLSITGRCFTILNDADVLLCGGATASHADYVTVWAAIADHAGPWMLGIERRARRFLAMLTERRVDALVRADFAAGRRWASRLGFIEEACLSAYFGDGTAAVIYRYRGEY